MTFQLRRQRAPLSLMPVQVGTPQCAIPDDATVLAEAKTMYTRLFGGDWLLYYTTARWIGGCNGHWMYFSNWDTALCEAIWFAYGEWETAEDRRARAGFLSEADFVAAVAQQLKHEGWACQTEVRTKYGRIDLLATRAGARWIIEAKLSMHASDVTCALGQLLCGLQAYPDAQLWFATPARIQTRWKTVFAQYNITLLEGPWTKPLE